MSVARLLLFRQFLTSPTQIDVEAITAAARDGAPVGSCPCGGYLRALVPSRGWSGRGPLWVQVECRHCGRDIAAPEGRLAEQWRRGA